MTFGAVRISPSDIYHVLIYHLFGRVASGAEELLQSSIAKIIWEIRLPRVLLGIIAGAGLSVCGTVMQSTVQNPLAEPYILGISSGASLGATFAVFMGTHLVFMENVSIISVLSFLGALGANASSIDMLYRLSLQDKIIGTIAIDNEPGNEWADLYESLPKLCDKMTVSKEVIAEAEPDIIIGRSATFEEGTFGSIVELNALGINVYAQKASDMSTAVTMESVIDDVRNLGDHFHKEQGHRCKCQRNSLK